MIKTIKILFVLLMISCSSNSIKEQEELNTKKESKCKSDDKIRMEIKDNSGINIQNYTLLDSKSEFAIGDYYESVTIQIDTADFKNIVRQILESPYYVNHPNLQSQSNHIGLKSKSWLKTPFGYKFEYFIAKIDKVILYEVDTLNYTIEVMHAEE